MILLYRFILSFLSKCTWANPSFSLEGEDLLLNKILNYKQNGFYIDVGSHHPIRFSNTFLFYLKGWKGINIDARPGSAKSFKFRKRDKNVEAAISDKESNLKYFEFNESALNTFDPDLANQYIQEKNYIMLGKREIQTTTLAKILEQNIEPHTQIDFLSVDVEGLDFQVLKSNNWIKFRPDYILCEILGGKELAEKSEITSYLKTLHYRLIANTLNTYIFQRER